MRTPATNKWRYRKAACVYHTAASDEGVGIPALVAAIIRQAIMDYQYADEYLKGVKIVSEAAARNRLVISAENTKKEVVKFFHSRWYGTLCDIDPHIILRKLGVEK